MNWYYESFQDFDVTCGIEDGAIRALYFGRVPQEGGSAPSPESDDLWERTRAELTEYLAGTRRGFDLPISYSGTEFQTLVWDALRRIQYGETWTYGRLAAEIGRPRAARAVGGACHNNPISIIVPCHRVLGSDGSLTGFGGGIDVKRRLLTLEGSI